MVRPTTSSQEFCLPPVIGWLHACAQAMKPDRFGIRLKPFRGTVETSR
jgi:hypothetical protein